MITLLPINYCNPESKFHLVSERVAITRANSTARRLWRLAVQAKLRRNRYTVTTLLFSRYSETPARVRALRKLDALQMARYANFIYFCDGL